MRAVWYEQIGPAAAVLRVGEMDPPEPGPGEVLVRVRASGVNPHDVKKRAGKRAPMAHPLIVPHNDGAGLIERVGVGVDRSRIGERVWIHSAQWERPFGTAAEYTCVPADLAWPLADGTTFEEGACLGIPAMTAHRAVFADGSVYSSCVLVHGGAGPSASTPSSSRSTRGPRSSPPSPRPKKHPWLSRPARTTWWTIAARTCPHG